MLQKNDLRTVDDLKRLIHNTLDNRINRNCALFALPYYKNIGDVLIWEGERTFLTETRRNIVCHSSIKTCDFPELEKDTTILIQGGGNIGDLYPEYVRFLQNILEHYKHNPILIFPQTVYFKDKYEEAVFFSKLSEHDDLTFCCRDWKSYDTVVKYIGTKALQLPDMAFCINTDIFRPWQLAQTKSILHIKRNDVEQNPIKLGCKCDCVADWPPFELKFTWPIIINTIYDRSIRLFPFLRKSWDKYSESKFKEDMIKTGVRFISPYTEVYTERLHGAILSILLGKNVVILDNSYGKNSTFYESWLSSFENVKLLQK